MNSLIKNYFNDIIINISISENIKKKLYIIHL